ncbi:Spy/CpxP family protein refolding chaperone [Methylosinus sp. H3A]|uniref:Spy/CpxP family protein refolding chaperone n=1 Tax=Methylosinus sp. H3A TaxID=2785786 RepID=UPI0018C2EEAC|nr:Spy/CpxP family protein refolding chaperone [Methylosinus sp. H3A]MBG0810165.1 Spy/CpxP family protein refolding chaperone [Methylosinus sp. H3A]
MLLRFAIALATSLLVCVVAGAPVAEPFNRAADNPFVARRSPLETHIDEWRLALRLSGEQERLFSAFEQQLQVVVQDRDAAIVAAAIDRNRDSVPRDPGAPLRARAERLSRHVDNLRALADAETSFFASLSDEQRRIADRVLPRDVLGVHDLFRRRGIRPDRNG